MTDLSALSGAGNIEAVNREQFAILVLNRMGIPVGQHNKRILVQWMQAEFSQGTHGPSDGSRGTGKRKAAKFNPMATTHGWNGQGLPGHTPDHFNYNNGQPVQNYATLELGVEATAKTLMNRHYPTVRNLLTNDDPPSEWARLNADPESNLNNELRTYGGLLKIGRDYKSFWELGAFSDYPVMSEAEPSQDTSFDWNTIEGASGSRSGAQTFSRVPQGYEAYDVNGKTYVVYNMTPNGTKKIFFEHDQAMGRVDTSVLTEGAWQERSQDWINGGTSGDSLLGDSDVNNGTRSWDDIVTTLLMEAGLWGTEALESDDVLGVIGEYIARPDMSDEELTALLQETDWWDQTTAEYRAWNDLSSADQIKAIKDNAQTISGLWTAYTGEQMDWMGFDTDGDGTVSVDEINAGNSELGEWALKLASGEVSQQTVVLEWVRPAALEIEGSPANRVMIEEEQARNEQGFTVSENKQLVADLWERYGLDISDADATRYANQLYMNQVSLAELEGSTTTDEDGEMQSLENTARHLSNVRWAGKPEDVDFETWSSPYADQYASMLEVGKPTFRDAQFTKFLDEGVGSEGFNMYDFKKALRQDARWKNTENAKASYSQTLGSIGRMMGFG